MQNEMKLPPGEMLRQVMRHWVTGVAVVTSRFGDTSHGMTINSFLSISLDPALVTVTMNNSTRTYNLVQQSGFFAVTVLSYLQKPVAEMFAGRVLDENGLEPEDRFAGLDLFTMQTGAPLIAGGVAFVDCRLVQQVPFAHSVLCIGEVLEARHLVMGTEESLAPLVYFNRSYAVLE